MNNNKWAVIVYGRTYEVDFRFITIPNDFKDERIDWVQKYINSTTRYSQKLSQNPCWSLFKDDKHCVVGVTCMIKDLVGDSSEPEDITKDMYGRDLFVFVGYVAKIPHPPIPPMNLELFKELYNSYVLPRWNEKSYDVRKIEEEGKHFSYYQQTFNLDQNNQSSEDVTDFSELKLGEHLSFLEEKQQPFASEISQKSYQFYFNSNKERRFVWSINANESLWYFANSESKTLSLCLGLSSKKYFLEGEFLNGTALDVISDHNDQISEILEKPKSIPPRNINSNPRENSQTNKNKYDENNWTNDTKTEPKTHRFNQNKVNRKPQKQREINIAEPEFYNSQLTYTRNFVRELRQFFENGFDRQNLAVENFKNKIEEAKRNIQQLQKEITQQSGDNSFAEEFNQIVREFENVTTNFANMFDLHEKSQADPHKNFNQGKNNQVITNSQNIELDYGFKQKSEQNNRTQKKNWF